MEPWHINHLSKADLCTGLPNAHDALTGARLALRMLRRPVIPKARFASRHRGAQYASNGYGDGTDPAAENTGRALSKFRKKWLD